VCDILIGADGIKSGVRRSLLREQAHRARAEGRQGDSDNLLGSIDPVWTGILAYTAVVSAERLKARAPNHRAFGQPTQYLGKNGYILVYPIAQGRIINVAGFHKRAGHENTSFTGPWIRKTEKEELLSAYSQWEPEVQILLECIERPSQWAVHTSKPLNSYISGRVALLGDAAHAMEPHQGTGAGQAIEDAYLLATLLGQRAITMSSISRALRAYDAIRRPFVNDIARRNRLTGYQFMFLGDNFDWDNCPDEVLRSRLQYLGGNITNNWDWTWLTTIDELMEEGIRLL
jgi:salicylate hydroxylase